jgi:CRP-like cAMP-binding protein
VPALPAGPALKKRAVRVDKLTDLTATTQAASEQNSLMETATLLSDTESADEKAHLRSLVPLHTLPGEALDALLEHVGFESLAAGALLFQQGDTNHEHVYLLGGTVALLDEGRVADTIRSGSDTARFPLAHQIPRKHAARAESRVRIARLDSRLLSDALARTQTVDYQVADLAEATEDDWMGMLLQSRILQQVPAANIQRVMMSVEQVEVAAGEDLVRQGDPGDYYYMLTSGRAVVRRDSGDGQGPCELATLGPGDAFGEEALLSDNPRNSTVSMLDDGAVLRLSKEHFLDLIHNPLLDRVDMAKAQAKVEQGALWLDVRSSVQYDESHLPGAINCPFESLRYQAASLAPDHHYVLYSNSGGRAMASAFLLTERGFEVSVLEGGLRAAAPPSGVSATPVLAAPPPAVDDDVVRERLREAEQRAQELEQRLRTVEQLNQDAESARQQQLAQVRSTVDQARRKLLESEAQKREALQAREQAYAEMERLTGSLEALENERASLQDRMAEIQGLDKQLQARLIKAERELIGASERAESATSSLQELSDRLSEVLEQREEEREQNARERGELKEEITALQLELEQATLDLQELRDGLPQSGQPGDAAQAALQQTLAEREAELRRIEALRREETGALQAQLAEARAEIARQLAAGASLEADLQGLRRELEQHCQQTAAEGQDRARVEQEVGALARRLEDSERALEAARAGQAELAAALERVEAERERLQAALDEAAQEGPESELAALRAELELVREQAAAEAAEMREKLAIAETEKLRLHQADEREVISHEAMRQRIETLEVSLGERQRELAAAEDSRHMLEDALEDANSQLDKARLEYEQALEEVEAALASRREAERAREQLQESLQRIQEGADQVRGTDLRDARLSAPATVLGMDSLRAPRRWPAALLGFCVGAGGLVAWALYSGNGAMFAPLFDLLGL